MIHILIRNKINLFLRNSLLQAEICNALMENKQHAINVINHENNNYLVYHPIVSKHLLRRLAANMLDFFNYPSRNCQNSCKKIET